MYSAEQMQLFIGRLGTQQDADDMQYLLKNLGWELVLEEDKRVHAYRDGKDRIDEARKEAILAL